MPDRPDRFCSPCDHDGHTCAAFGCAQEVSGMGVIERCAWWCPDCRWTASYAEPMLEVFCVRCMHEGRGAGHRCEKFVPAEQLRGAVEDALNVLVQAATDDEGILDATKLANLVRQRLRHQSFGGQS